MYTPYANYSVNPADPFTYQDLQQLRERQAKDMCHYTVKFFECDHKTDDNVKGCSLWNKTGTHCDIDNPAVRKREDCSIRSENVTGLCPRCQSRERARFLREKEEERERIEREREEELIQRDLEKARLADQEEARRSAEAHEAHIRQVQEESEASWRIEHESKVSQTIESAAHESMNLAVQEAEALSAAMEASRKSYAEEMEDRFGSAVEEESSRLEAIKRQSTMDWHHRNWGQGAERLQYNGADFDLKISTNFSIKSTHRHVSTSSRSYNTSTSNGASAYSSSTGSSITGSSSASTAIHNFQPPPQIATSKETAVTSNTSTTQSTRSDVTSNSSTIIDPRAPSPVASALSGTSAHTVDTNVLFQKAAELQSTTTRTTTTRSRTTTVRDPSPPPPPPPPPPSQPRVSAPAFPPIDFSQPPKNQDYGHHFIGGRRQPIHPSQKLAAEHPLSPAAPVNPHVRRPQPTVRLAGGVTSPVRSPTASISGFAGSSTSTQRGPARPPPGSTSQEEPVNELQAMWNRKGIKRETDEDEEEDGIATESISPSESASQIDSGRRRGWRK